MTYYCPSCGEEAVKARGPKDAPILIIGEMPTEEDLSRGVPFVGGAGHVLRSELARVGLDMSQFRITNLWLHEPTKNENCLKAGYDLVLDEAKGREAILMVGSEVVSTFTEYNVMAINGLRLDKSDHPFSCKLCVATLNPAICFRKGIGETRFGIESFNKYLLSEGIIDE